MDKEKILNEINRIKQEIKEREYAIKALESLIGSDYNEMQREIEIKTEFPSSVRPEKQVLYLFENIIDKGIKMPEIQALFKTYKPLGDLTIYNAVKHNVETGKISILKYNNSNQYCFYALPDWIDKDKKDFKKEFMPNEDLLPREIKSIDLS